MLNQSNNSYFSIINYSIIMRSVSNDGDDDHDDD